MAACLLCNNIRAKFPVERKKLCVNFQSRFNLRTTDFELNGTASPCSLYQITFQNSYPIPFRFSRMVFSNSFPLANCAAKFRGKRTHLLFKGYTIIRSLLQSHITSRHQHIVVVLYLLNGRRFAESGSVFVLAVFPRQLWYVRHELDIVVACSLFRRLTIVPNLRASIKRISLERLRNLPLDLLRARNQRQAGIMVL